ncbi:efflux RND transporter permease subunit [Kiloniella laminariae]|uniref:Efflux RND transporter permease subunit n=1 Tax=Kiloniella laminariae TaxID=454162 RepID=A0ABT4LHW4_9PROT|nr:efflux RND transporter permease subunit [Kiloniella laminariae]MCZ4280691.1 efflux RND transporter permease subunit [Kiloniella laminariae]
MHFLTGWFIKNPVAANLMMAFFLFLGWQALTTIRIEGFPRIPPESISITTSYSGATTAQIDELITQKVEKALEGIEGVRSVSSQSNNDSSVITLRRSGGQDLQKLLDKVRLRIDGISDFPAAAERPVIEDGGYDFPALYLNLHGQTDPVTLQRLSERLREELLSRPELSRMNIWGLYEREMQIELDPQILQRHNLTVADVVTQIKLNSLNYKSGVLRTKGGTISLKTDNQARFSTEYAAIPVIEHADGTRILLGDIATVQDGFKEGDYLFRFNGELTSGMEILIGQKENLLQVSEVVHDVVETFRTRLPPDVKLTIWGNSADYIADRLELLKNNGIQGLLLVLLVLSLFLNVRLAFWVAMGIPVSLMGALAVAGSKWVDYSLNDVTTFGLIIVLGILVDDAVVVGESVFEERRADKDPFRATEKGVRKVAVATVFGVLTTIAAFFPMLMLENPLGKVLASFSGIVIFALTFSLIESKFILPAHLARTKLDQQPRFLPGRLWTKVQQAAQNLLHGFRDRIYGPLLARSIRHRYATLVFFIAAATLGIGLIGLGKIKTVFFPDIPGQVITVSLEMDARAPFELTRDNLEHIRLVGEELSHTFQQEKSLENAPVRSMFMFISDASTAQIFAELTPVSERPDLGIIEFMEQWRQHTGTIEGATQLQFTGSEELAGGFLLRLYAKDSDLLALASQDLREFLADINGVNNIRDSLTPGQPQLDIQVKPEARNLGFTTETLASQIGNAFGGAEVQKIMRDGTELKVIVQNTDTTRDSIDDLLRSQVRSNNGNWIPFQSVAEIKGSYVSGTIHRENGKLVNTVAASINRSLVASEEVAQAVFEQLVPELAARYPGLEIKGAGELEEIGEIQGGMKQALLLAAVLIYVLMAVPLKSYWQPFIILAIVPLGFVSAAIGHLIMDLPLSVLSFFGMLALTGVVINDSLVLITSYNQLREKGISAFDAIHQAGLGRFRAIFLTTATTVIGLSPLLSETSEQAQYLIPAAVSLAYGELFSTALMLLLVPALLAITEDFKRIFPGPEREKIDKAVPTGQAQEK